MLAASEITDRAKRYRAHSPDLRPEPPKQCGFCGSKKNVVPHHISGKEADLDPQNLMWACKSCNTRLGFLYRNHGIGTRTMQYNPSKGTRREQMERYRLAQAVLSGTARETHMSREAAQEIVDRTPAHLRSEYMRKNQGIVGSALGYSLVDRALPVVGRTADRATRSILGRRNGKRRNSQRAAAGTYRDFHGREPEVDTVIETEMHEHSVLPGIGELCWMVIRYETDDDEIQDVILRDFDGALLAMNEQRNHLPQLFIEGGDQKVDLKQFEIGPPLHEHETLGRMVCVAYYTTKDHLGDEGGEAEFVHVIEMPVDMAEFKEWGLQELARAAGLSNSEYWAELEEETEGAQGPDVIYDTRNKLMLLSGGTYTLPDEGIAN